jgi:uncharacterized protein (TIGR02646 family)
MFKFTRPECPDYLADCWEQLGDRFATNRLLNSKYRFDWTAAFRYSETLEHLIQMTQGHCAFCDGGDLGAVSRKTIEHFRPKSTFHHLAYKWENLYPCCDRCQSEKLEKFHEILLVGDEDGYEFDKYFMVDYSAGTLTPNPLANPADQRRAQITIDLYGLNLEVRNLNRKKELKRYLRRDPEVDILDDFSYRYFLADAEP